MSNLKYLDRFINLVNIATAYKGQLHDQAILDIATENVHTGTAFTDLKEE